SRGTRMLRRWPSIMTAMLAVWVATCVTTAGMPARGPAARLQGVPGLQQWDAAGNACAASTALLTASTTVSEQVAGLPSKLTSEKTPGAEVAGDQGRSRRMFTKQ